MRKTKILWAVGLSALACSQAMAASVTTYTDATSFTSNVSSYAYDDFSNFTVPGDLGSSYTYSSNGFTATFQAEEFTPGDDDVWSASGEISTDGDDEVLLVTFSPNVTAVGGDFFISDSSGGFLSNYDVWATIEDSSSNFIYGDTYVPLTDPQFRGYTSSTPINSLLIFPTAGIGYWPTISSLYFGTAGAPVIATPLPASLFGGLGLIALLAGTRRFRRAAIA